LNDALINEALTTHRYANFVTRGVSQYIFLRRVDPFLQKRR
jgi:hypothetical protein